MSDKLVAIESEHWAALRDIYSADNSHTIYSHCTVENYIQWREKEPHAVDWTFYSLNGEWGDGTYALVDRSFVYIATRDETGERLVRLLQLLDYTKPLKFVCILKKDHPAVLEALKRQNVEIETNVDYLLFHLPREQALKLEAESPPEGITLKPIRECDVHVIDAARPDLCNVSTEWKARVVRLNANIGAYNDEGQLVGWFYRAVDGQPNGVHVLREYNGRGIGRALAKNLLRQIEALGYMNCITILEDNVYSRNIFEPMGFELVGKTSRVFTLPKTHTGILRESSTDV